MNILADPGDTYYNPAKLLDTIRRDLSLRNDAALARSLDLQAPLLSKIRNAKLPISAGVLVRLHEVSGRSIDDLRFLMGDRRARFRISAGVGQRVRRRVSIAQPGIFPVPTGGSTPW
jgi:hypothetical protein